MRRWLGNIVQFLWGAARGAGRMHGSAYDLRPGSGAATLLFFFMIIFFIIGAVLLALGFDLDDVDVWLARQTGWLDWVGDRLFNLGGALLFGISLLVLGGGLWQRLPGNEGEEPIGWGCILVAPLGMLFGWAMLTMVD